MTKRALVAMVLVGVPFVAVWACGGGDANQGTTTPVASAQPSTTAPATTTTTSATATSSATAATPSATAEPAPPPPPPEYSAARDKWDAVQKKAVDLMSNVKAGTPAACDKVAADLSKLAKDPANKKIAQAHATEYAKLSAAQKKVLTASAMASAPAPASGADGGPLCPNHKKLGDAVGALGELTAMAYPKN